MALNLLLSVRLFANFQRKTLKTPRRKIRRGQGYLRHAAKYVAPLAICFVGHLWVICWLVLVMAAGFSPQPATSLQFRIAKLIIKCIIHCFAHIIFPVTSWKVDAAAATPPVVAAASAAAVGIGELAARHMKLVLFADFSTTLRFVATTCRQKGSSTALLLHI